MARLPLTDESVKGLAPPTTGNRITYDVPRGPRDRAFVRGFALRVTAAGLRTFLLVYVAQNGRERRHRIGDYGPFTVHTAREAARKLRKAVDEGRDPFAEAVAAKREAEARDSAERAGRERDRATLGDLLMAYIALLEQGKKASASKVRAELVRTVQEPFPDLWDMPAGNVTADDLLRVLGRLVRAEKWRQAEKTRAYLRAAYQANVASRNDAGTSHLYRKFRHVANIAADLAPITRPVGEEDDGESGARALSVDELRFYWNRIRTMPGQHGALLRFHLLSGAQRAEQLARLSERHLDRDAGTVTMLDTKGRRKRPRRHVVPLLPEARAAIDQMAGTAGPFLFSLDHGKHGAGYHTLRAAVLRVAEAMKETGEIAETFTPGTLRATVETRLAAAAVSKEVRAQLQSHGLGGVQDRHYDRHDYLDEKREALQRLRELMEPGKVVRMRRKA